MKRSIIALLSVSIACSAVVAQQPDKAKITLSCSGYSVLTDVSGEVTREPINSWSIVIDLKNGTVWDGADTLQIVGSVGPDDVQITARKPDPWPKYQTDWTITIDRVMGHAWRRFGHFFPFHRAS
jgi:hypothetical protein